MILHKPVQFLSALCLCLSGLLPAQSQTPAPLPASDNILYQFGAISTDASYPVTALMTASDGNFYGATYYGGTYSNGSLYSLSPTGKVTTLYSFTGGNDGRAPYNTPIEASDGNLYGITNYGGANGSSVTGGTIYQYNLKTGVLQIVYTFVNDGVAGFADMVDDGKGTIYGTANADDSSGNGKGSVWSFNYLTNTFKTLHVFNDSDGYAPVGGLVLASDGNFYGTTDYGGPYVAQDPLKLGYGTAFVIAPDGSNFHVFHNFTSVQDGCGPTTAMVQGPDGNLYGTTYDCGPNGAHGVFYRITPNGANSSLQPLYAFTNPDGTGPLHGRLFLGGDGNYYVTGSSGGLNSAGQVMQLTPSGVKADVYDFSYSNNGGYEAEAGPFEGPDGNLYVTATYGGTYQSGTLNQLLTALPPAISLTAGSASITNGSSFSLTWAVNNAYSINSKLCYASSTDGSWSGSLATTGTATITPTSANALVNYAITCGGYETATASVVVGTIPPQITTGSLAGGVTRGSYNQKLSEIGGVAPFTWKISSGSLPDGLMLDSAKGVISGTPATPGTYTFTVQLTDSENTPQSATADLSITIVHAPLVAPTNTLTLAPSSIVLGNSVTLTAQVSGPSGVPVPTGTVQFSADGNALSAPVALVNGVAILSGDVPTITGSYGISATYSGDSNYTTGNVATSTLTVTAATSAAITASPTTLTIANSGGSGLTTLKLLNFPSGAVTFTCTGLPAGAQCNFGALSSTSTSALQITTSSSSNASLRLPSHANEIRTIYALVLPGLFAAAGLFRKRKRIVRGLLLFMLLLPLANALTGCSNNASNKGSVFTPPGTNTIAVTAASGGQTASVNLTLVVQ